MIIYLLGGKRRTIMYKPKFFQNTRTAEIVKAVLILNSSKENNQKIVIQNQKNKILIFDLIDFFTEKGWKKIPEEYVDYTHLNDTFNSVKLMTENKETKKIIRALAINNNVEFLFNENFNEDLELIQEDQMLIA